MLYCENCSAAWEESRGPLCGSTRLREAQEGDLCFLARKGRLFSTMLRDVLRDHEIPFTVRGIESNFITIGELEYKCFLVGHIPFADKIITTRHDNTF